MYSRKTVSCNIFIIEKSKLFLIEYISYLNTAAAQFKKKALSVFNSKKAQLQESANNKVYLINICFSKTQSDMLK